MAVRFDSTGSDQYYESPQNDSTDDMLPGAGALNGNDSILIGGWIRYASGVLGNDMAITVSKLGSHRGQIYLGLDQNERVILGVRGLGSQVNAKEPAAFNANEWYYLLGLINQEGGSTVANHTITLFSQGKRAETRDLVRSWVGATAPVVQIGRLHSNNTANDDYSNATVGNATLWRNFPAAIPVGDTDLGLLAAQLYAGMDPRNCVMSELLWHHWEFERANPIIYDHIGTLNLVRNGSPVTDQAPPHPKFPHIPKDTVHTAGAISGSAAVAGFQAAWAKQANIGAGHGHAA